EATSKWIRWDALTALAQVDAARKDNAAADEHFKEAVETIDAARAEIEGSDLRLAFLQVAKELYDSYVGFLVATGRSRDALRVVELNRARTLADRKSTRLNSSHLVISYAVFCLKKKTN